MPEKVRRTRSDALRNRERLLEVAAQVFAERGLDAAPAAIARQAGVGVGTLYRHFPTREALIDAAYQHQLAIVCAQAAALLPGRTAAEAIRLWMEHFLGYVRAKAGMSEALATVIASGTDPYADSRALLLAAIESLLEAGARDGSLRTDITADDVLLFAGGAAHITGTGAQAGRMIDLAMDALTKGALTKSV